MTVLAVIPARLGATRLPRKPLRLLGGVPLVVRVAQRVAGFSVAQDVVVATDSEDVLSACRAYGVTAVITRADHPSGTDRVAEVAARAEYRHHDIVLNVQGDEPFVAFEALSGAVSQVAGGRFTLGTAAAPALDAILAQPDVVKVVIADDGRALYFSRAPIPFLREPADAPVRAGLVRQHVGVYAYTRDALASWVSLVPHPLELVERLEQLRPLAHGHAMGVALVAASDAGDDDGGIDTEDDLRRAELRMAAAAAHTPRPADRNSSAILPLSSPS